MIYEYHHLKMSKLLYIWHLLWTHNKSESLTFGNPFTAPLLSPQTEGVDQILLAHPLTTLLTHTFPILFHSLNSADAQERTTQG